MAMNSFKSLPAEVMSILSRPIPSLAFRVTFSASTARRNVPIFRHTIRHNSSYTPSKSWLPVPFVTEQIGGAHHTTDLFSRLLKERIVAVYGEVDDRMAATVTASLLFLEADDPSKPINLYINSPGGSVSAGLAIYDTCQYITPKISTICLGQAASMGSLLLAGGAPGKRFALPHSSIMLHQPSGGYAGTAADIAIHAKEILRIRKQLNEIYQRHLRPKEGKVLGLEEIEKMMERDYFLSAKEALELGVVDEIMESRKEVKEEG
jgi:ATP-dependent Clp protease, protease subunit